MEKTNNESDTQRKEYDILNDPIFAGEEFFFPPCDDSEDEDCDDEFSDKKNLIVVGASGTGKSRKLESDRVKYFGENYERVAFHPGYSYAQFIGAYKPIMKPKVNGADGEEELAYEFIPGPFLRVLVKALNDPWHNFCLIIEDINRADAAAVLGDVFHLLDRGSDGESEYAIAVSEEMKKFLNRSLSKEIENLKIPSNMYIWATMCDVDQGVFPIDFAFKRRWMFESMDKNDENY